MFIILFDKEIWIDSANMKVVCVALNFFVFFFFKRWGNNPFRFIILLHVKLPKKPTNKIMVGWTPTGFKMFHRIH